MNQTKNSRSRSLRHSNDIFLRYWKAYGGWKALFLSRYFHISLLTTCLLYGFWSKPEWWETSLNVLPNIIGFSVGAFAILLSFGADRFVRLMARAKMEQTNALEELSASFTHFIVVQFLALFVALVAKGLYVVPPLWLEPLIQATSAVMSPLAICFWGLGAFLLIYALACGIAATMRIFRLTSLFSKIAPKLDDDKPDATTSGPQA